MQELSIETELKGIIKSHIITNLKQKVKGKQYVSWQGDNLIIDFYYDNQPVFRYIDFNLFAKVIYGIDTRKIVESATKEYKRYIIGKYFK